MNNSVYKAIKRQRDCGKLLFSERFGNAPALAGKYFAKGRFLTVQNGRFFGGRA
jgi:hypothetical protein